MAFAKAVVVFKTGKELRQVQENKEVRNNKTRRGGGEEKETVHILGQNRKRSGEAEQRGESSTWTANQGVVEWDLRREE